MVKTRSATTKRSIRYYDRLNKLSKKTKQKNVVRNVGVKQVEEQVEEMEEAILSQPICRDKNQTEAQFRQQCHNFKIKYPNYNA